MQEVTKRAFRELVSRQASRAHVTGMRRYGTSRQINPRQELAYRLCHHDFCGLRQQDAAEVMNMPHQTISRTLAELKKSAPQLFPILAPRIAKMYSLFMEGHTCMEIADILGVTPRAVQKAIKELIRSGQLYFRSGSMRRLSYAPWQDEYIKEKF